MELRHLRYFVAVAEELNIRRAAARLCIAPPPLSVQIRQLETEIGTDLFSREKRRLKLTDAGRFYLDHARHLLADAQRGILLARQAAKGEIGHLAIGHYTPACFRVLSKVLPVFKKHFPQVQLSFHSLSVSPQLDAIRREDIEVGFVFLPVPQNEFDMQELMQEPVVAVIPKEHPLAVRRSVSIKELSTEPLILPSRAVSPETYSQIEQLFLTAGATLNVAYELENALSMISLVSIGAGCSLLPEYLRGVHQKGVVYKSIRPPNIVNTLAMVKKKGSKGLPAKFFQLVMDVLPGIAPNPSRRR